MEKYEKFKSDFIKASKIFVQKYDIDEANQEAIKIILTYFAGIDTKKYPLTKGLLICGFYGSGKTITLKIIQQLIKNFAIHNVRDIVSEFNIGGFDAIHELAKTKIRVFDDICQENNGRYYGNDTNVIQELILRRYEKFQNHGLITHFTTNEGNDQLKYRYGERVYDRLREMCKIVILGDNKKSRRDTYNPISRNVEIKGGKIDVEKANYDAILRTIEKIYNGQEVLSQLYVNAYNYLAKNGIINLADELKQDITNRAKEELRDDRIKIKNGKGNIFKIRDMLSKMDVDSNLVVYQKKIAIKDFLQGKKEMQIPLNEILNKNINE